MGIAPLQYLSGDTTESLGLTGKESFSIEFPENMGTGATITVKVC